MHKLAEHFCVKSDFLCDLKKNLNILAKSRRYFNISFLATVVGGASIFSAPYLKYA